MQPLTRNSLIVLVLLAIVAIVARWDGHRAGVQERDEQANRVAHDTIVKSIRVVEEKRIVDTVRLRVAEAKATVSRTAFDTAAAKVEAVADTSASVPDSLVVPAIQTCRDMRDALLEQVDVLKVNLADADLDTDLQTRRADLAEDQLKKQRPSRFGFKSGAASAAAVILTVLHFAR